MIYIVGVSFVSIFIVSYHLVFWVGGAARSLSWDYLPGVPQGREAERHFTWKEKPIGGLIARYILRIDTSSESAPSSEKTEVESISEKTLEKTEDVEAQAQDMAVQPTVEDLAYDNDPDIQLARRTSRLSVTSHRSRHSSTVHGVSSSQPPVPPPLQSEHPDLPDAQPPPPFLARLKHTLRPLSAAVTPITCSLALALPIALIVDLKALFVNVQDQGGPYLHGPDGNPPLAFIMDTGNLSFDLQHYSQNLISYDSYIPGRYLRAAVADHPWWIFRADFNSATAVSFASIGNVCRDGS